MELVLAKLEVYCTVHIDEYNNLDLGFDKGLYHNDFKLLLLIHISLLISKMS